MKKKEKKQSFLEWLLFFMLAIFLGYAIMRASYIQQVYKDFREAIDGSAAITSNYIKKGNFIYGVTTPQFPLWNGGSVYISEQGVIYADGKTFDKVDLEIYPQMHTGYKIEVEVDCFFYDEEKNVPYSEKHVFQLDEKMKLLSAVSEAEKEIFEAHIPQIKERYQQAYEMWGILRLEDE